MQIRLISVNNKLYQIYIYYKMEKQQSGEQQKRYTTFVIVSVKLCLHLFSILYATFNYGFKLCLFSALKKV